MAINYYFSADDLGELVENDLTLPASLAKLINEGGDIRAFLVGKLVEQAEAVDRFRLGLSSDSDSDDWNSVQNAVDADEARYINTHHFA